MIVNDSKTFKSHLGGPQQSMDLVTWKPFVESALDTYIIPAVGTELLSEIDGATDGVKYELLKKMQRAVALYSYLIAIPQMTVITGDAGIVQPNPEGGVVITKWMHVNLSVTTAKNADVAFELALQFLEAHVNDKDENDNYVFSAYRASESYTRYNGLLIKSATELTSAMPFVQNSRRMYLALFNYLKVAENDYLPNLIGDDFCGFLLGRIGNAEITEAEKKALEYCRVIVAYRAMEDALVFLNISEDMRLVSTTDGLTNENVIDSQRLSQLKLECKESYHRWGNRLIDYLNKNASDEVFGAYFSSELYPKTGESMNAKDRFLKRFEDKNKNYVIL